MGWTRNIFLALVLCLATKVNCFAQSFELGASIYPGIAHSSGFELGSNGFSLDFDYLHILTSHSHIHGGVELGITGWGSQLLIPTGFRWGRTAHLDLEWLNGMALYQQGAHYVFGAEASYVHTFFKRKKHRLILSTGLRYTIQPAYKAFSPIYAYLDLPIRIHWGFGKPDGPYTSAR